MAVAVPDERLPSKSRVLQACRGGAATEHPLLCAAHQLTLLHEQRLGAEGELIHRIDRERARLVREIDRWVTTAVVPAHGSAHLHTETIGAVIDRLGQLTVAAYAALASSADWELGEAWERLAELAVGYEDLIDEVRTGRRRLPGGP